MPEIFLMCVVGGTSKHLQFLGPSVEGKRKYQNKIKISYFCFRVYQDSLLGGRNRMNCSLVAPVEGPDRP